MMRHRTSNNLAYYTFTSLSRGVTHAVSTRHGGTSPPPFDTLNLSHSVGDGPSNVQLNLTRLHTALGLDPRTTVSAAQAQADQVARVDQRDVGTRIQGVDALITNRSGLPLLLRYADCVPVLLHDPHHHAIGIVHAGWRGTVARVVQKSVYAMRKAFGTRAADLVACIGPSIGPCCYRVGDEVVARVQESLESPDLLLSPQNSSVHLDLWKANEMQLRASGVQQVEIARICTADHVEEFFSWRKEDKKTGRFGAIIAVN